MDNCEHDFQFDGDEVFTQLENLIRLSKSVTCIKCGQQGMDVFVYIGTYPKDMELFKEPIDSVDKTFYDDKK
jgi:hypothetical protein